MECDPDEEIVPPMNNSPSKEVLPSLPKESTTLSLPITEMLEEALSNPTKTDFGKLNLIRDYMPEIKKLETEKFAEASLSIAKARECAIEEFKNSEEYKELIDKAWKYDDLCK